MEDDEQALRRDLAAPAFRLGERRGKWRLEGLLFPYALFFVAAPPRPSGPGGFLLRSECKGYSGTPPTSQLWHGGRNVALPEANRPRNRQGAVLIAFSSWGNCLYHPIDRLARTHGCWATMHPELLWTAEKDITFLLETVHGIFNSSEYTGADLPAAALTVPPEFVAASAESAT